MAVRPRSPRGSGDQLADEIIDATTELLIGLGSADAVSIRAVAQRVGVTPPSIYRHFDDKEELLDAVCAHYFERFADVMDAASAGIDDVLERALAQGLAYIRFAIDNDVVYRTAFSRITEPGKPSKTDEVMLSSAFVKFRGTVVDMMAHDLLPQSDPIETVLKLWSVAHGFASVMISKPGLPWGDDLALAEQTLRAVAEGLGRS
ncbi:TetR/AcrR family transcriptional regulator [Gordonia humi]|uniref:AcrR family transcriptional regulator n=1 Tax=Gordonia humi TaxID=686429 RepID=A0A840ERM7_9ACTN|nr:TetR/AcrR family transcriptional regulator [Gordonia humi]MBB4135495.1 AcrR family transcriptional regulator [Gordonia humi]